MPWLTQLLQEPGSVSHFLDVEFISKIIFSQLEQPPAETVAESRLDKPLEN